MLKVNQLRELIIKPALERLYLYSEDAVELLVFTCAVESDGGSYLKQINGPALGIYQMEPNTYNDIWENYIKLKKSLMTQISSNFEVFYMPDEDRMVYDLRYATLMARIHYDRVPESLPAHNDVNQIWEYYKLHYNTPKGAAEKEPSIQAYLNFNAGFKV
jgi:hypothetical protein